MSINNDTKWYIKEYNDNFTEWYKREDLRKILTFLQKFLKYADEGKIDFSLENIEYVENNKFSTSIFIVLDVISILFDMDYDMQIVEILEKLYVRHIRNNLYIFDKDIVKCRHLLSMICEKITLYYRFSEDSYNQIMRIFRFIGYIMEDLAFLGENPYIGYDLFSALSPEGTYTALIYVNELKITLNEHIQKIDLEKYPNKIYHLKAMEEMKVIILRVELAYSKYLKRINTELDDYLIPDLVNIAIGYL